MTGRIVGHPVLPEPERTPVTFKFNGETHEGFAGEPVAAALLAAGVRTLRTSPELAEPRGIYCGIGHCYECRVWLGEDRVRGCQAPIAEGDTFCSERCES